MLTKIQSDLDYISNFNPEMWQILRNKKIFATGCTGFLGTWMIYSFLHLNKKFNLNAELVCLTRSKKKNEQKFSGVQFVQGEIEHFSFPDGKFDFIIHGATEVSQYQNDIAQSVLLDVAYLGTKRIQHFAKNAEVKKILFLSSGAAYGFQPLDLPLVDETFNGAPDITHSKSTYGEAKRVCELLLFNDLIPTVSARIFATAGPFLPLESQFAFSHFLKSILNNENIVVQSNGKSTRSYLYIADLTLWLWILLLKGKKGEIYNVGSEEEISIFDLAQKIKSTLKSSIEIEVLGQEINFNRYIPSNKKIRDQFDISSLISLETGIKKSYEFLKDHYGI